MSTEPKGAISLANGAELTDASAEVARVWITDGAGSSVWINAGLLHDPQVFGHLMADTIRHAVRAYAVAWNIEESAALERIVAGVTDELRDQSSTITTLREGSLN